MKFVATPLEGVVRIDPERFEDDRGHFARTFCREDFAERGLPTGVEQCSTSFNERALTLRGMHWQSPPHGEDKLVRCTSGAVFDAVVDLRRGSKTFAHWYGLELSAENGRQLFIPRGFAHGFLTLRERSEVAYQMSVSYEPGAGAGVLWDDADIGIEWPYPPEVMSAKDRDLPRLAELDDAQLEELGA
ncbi:MAG: dTDP-4-dehydrorhamnose 3,5-epimerase [Acidobacteriota bacterium]